MMHPVSSAWEKWKNSREGLECLENDILLPNNERFLENRLHYAFEAAWSAAQRRLAGDEN